MLEYVCVNQVTAHWSNHKGKWIDDHMEYGPVYKECWEEDEFFCGYKFLALENHENCLKTLAAVIQGR